MFPNTGRAYNQTFHSKLKPSLIRAINSSPVYIQNWPPFFVFFFFGVFGGRELLELVDIVVVVIQNSKAASPCSSSHQVRTGSREHA